jgi:hypothetical protein
MTEERHSDELAERQARSARAFHFAGLLVLTVLPIALWHRVLGDVLTSFHWSLSYVIAEVSPWLLLLTGILFLVPVAISAGRSPDSWLYPRGRRAYIAWGTAVYLLGVVLAVELSAVWRYSH